MKIRDPKAFPRLREFLDRLDMPHLVEFEVPDEDVLHMRHMVEKQHPEETHEEHFARAVARIAYKIHGPKPQPVLAAEQPQQMPTAPSVIVRFPMSLVEMRNWATIIVLLLLILLLFSIKGHAQVQFQNSGGTPTAFCPFKVPCVVREGSNVTFSKIGSVVTINASSTASTAFSAITASTNSNAGTFAASGNTWDFAAATVFKLASGTHSQFMDPTDPTKIAQFDLSGLGTGATKTYAFPNASGALCLTSVCALQSTTVNGHALSANVTVTASDVGAVPTTTTVNGHALSANVTVTASDVGLGSVTNDAQTKAAIVPNTAPTGGQLLIGNAGGTAYAVLSLSGDCTLASTGAITCTKTGGVAFAASATTDTTVASNISSGTLPAGRMPALTGAVTSSAGAVATSPGKADVFETSLYCADAGASDTYACNLSPAITAYVTGTSYWFKANTANTGAASINFNAVGAKTIKKVQGGITTDLADNDIQAGQWVELIYDGTNMQMVSQLGNAPGGTGTVTNIATTSPITGGPITTTGTIACATCVISAASLTNNQLVFGAGSQGTAVGDLTGDVTTSGGKATTLATRYKTISCQPGLGDGVNAMAAASYLQSTCYNDSGSTWTITGIKCFTDNSGTSTLNATNSAGTGLLTGAVTCSSTFAAGTQSATTTLASGDYIKFTFAADGTSKQTTWVVTLTE